MKKIKLPKENKGYGVVGTWTNNRKLGGTLPVYLSDSRTGAQYEANSNERLFKFLEKSEQYLCEITIKPIKRLHPKKQFTD